MFLVSSCRCLRPIHWSQVLSWEWRCSWSADRRCSNYIWVIDRFIDYGGATYIRNFTCPQHCMLCCHGLPPGSLHVLGTFLALDPRLIYDTCFVRRRNGGRQRNQPRDILGALVCIRVPVPNVPVGTSGCAERVCLHRGGCARMGSAYPECPDPNLSAHSWSYW